MLSLFRARHLGQRVGPIPSRDPIRRPQLGQVLYVKGSSSTIEIFRGGSPEETRLPVSSSFVRDDAKGPLPCAATKGIRLFGEVQSSPNVALQGARYRQKESPAEAGLSRG